jgi:hypothetical protein
MNGTIRNNIHNAVLAGIKRTDYQAQVESLIQADAANALTDTMKQAIEKNPELVGLLAEKFLEYPYRCSVRNVFYEPSTEVMEQVSSLRAAEDAEAEAIVNVSDRVMGVLNQCDDTRDVVEVAPFLAPFMPIVEVKADRTNVGRLLNTLVDLGVVQDEKAQGITPNNQI